MSRACGWSAGTSGKRVTAAQAGTASAPASKAVKISLRFMVLVSLRNETLVEDGRLLTVYKISR